jgi:hypothetical protein
MKKRSVWASVCLVALCVLSFEDKAFGQSCYDQCQQGLASCMQAGQGDPAAELLCQRNYDKCTSDCMLQLVASKGDVFRLKAASDSFVSSNDQANAKEEEKVSNIAKTYSHSCPVEKLPFPLSQTGCFDSRSNMSRFLKQPSTTRQFVRAIPAAMLSPGF